MWSEQVRSEVHATHNWLSERKHIPAPKNYFSTHPFLKLWAHQITTALLVPSALKFYKNSCQGLKGSTWSYIPGQMPSPTAGILELNIFIGKAAPRLLL